MSDNDFMIIDEQEKMVTARKLKSLNIPIDTIMEVTGLSSEEIERL